MSKTDYSVEEIRNGIYKISEYNIANCYLVIGNEKALLIDCTVGTGDVNGLVKSITDKPVTLVGTHSHIDHIGAARQFGKVYVHNKEALYAPLQQLYLMRSQYLKMHPLSKKLGLDYKHFPKNKPYLTIKPFSDGHEFDIGGRILKAYLTPGHTNGSTCFKIENENIVFVGDSLIPALYLIYDHAASLSKWENAVSSLLPLWNGCEFYGGHGRTAVDHEGLKWQLETAKSIITQTEKNGSPFKRKNIVVKNNDDPHLVVAYRTDKIL